MNRIFLTQVRSEVLVYVQRGTCNGIHILSQHCSLDGDVYLIIKCVWALVVLIMVIIIGIYVTYRGIIIIIITVHPHKHNCWSVVSKCYMYINPSWYTS